MAPEVTLFVRSGDPACRQVEDFLRSRGIEPRIRDVDKDPGASATLFGYFGTIAVPVTKKGEALIVGYDPIQLMKHFPVEADAETLTLGAAIRTVTPDIAASHGLPYAFGVEVGAVRDHSVAQRSGLREGDLILDIAGYTLDHGAEQFRRAIAGKQEGDVVPIVVWRDGQRVPLAISFTRTTEATSREGAPSD